MYIQDSFGKVLQQPGPHAALVTCPVAFLLVALIDTLIGLILGRKGS